MSDDREFETTLREGASRAAESLTPAPADRARSLAALQARLETVRPASADGLARLTIQVHRENGLKKAGLGKQALRWVALPVIGLAALLVATTYGVRHNPTRHPIRTYTTAMGERTMVTLIDGTNVTLAPRTTLRLIEFGVGARTMTLDGEAYFQVVPGRAPFVVNAGGVVIRVLGTSFDVRHYVSDLNVRIVIAAGKVAIRGTATPHPATTAAAGTVVYATDSTAILKRTPNIDEYTAWTNGRLIFRGTSVPEMLRTLGAWYGYEFRLADSSLVQERVDAVIPANGSSLMLLSVQHILGVRMTYHGNVITLHPQNSSPLPSSRQREDPFKEVGR